MTSWAATMQAAVRVVARAGLVWESFCPTSGSIAALARWNSAQHVASIISVRLCSNRRAEAGACASWPAERNPRACAWSMAPEGIISTAPMLARVIAAIR